MHVGVLTGACQRTLRRQCGAYWWDVCVCLRVCVCVCAWCREGCVCSKGGMGRGIRGKLMMGQFLLNVHGSYKTVCWCRCQRVACVMIEKCSVAATSVCLLALNIDTRAHTHATTRPPLCLLLEWSVATLGCVKGMADTCIYCDCTSYRLPYVAMIRHPLGSSPLLHLFLIRRCPANNLLIKRPLPWQHIA